MTFIIQANLYEYYYNGPVYSGHPVHSSHSAYNGHLAFSQGWPLYTGSTPSFYVKLNDTKQCPLDYRNRNFIHSPRNYIHEVLQALVNIYSLLKQKIKSCNAKEKVKTARTVKHNNNRSNREKSLHHVAMVSGSQQTVVLQI